LRVHKTSAINSGNANQRSLGIHQPPTFQFQNGICPEMFPGDGRPASFPNSSLAGRPLFSGIP
jgi:hypothetical protein